MLSTIACDVPGYAWELQRALLRAGCECPAGNVVSVELAAQFLVGRERSTEVVFVALEPDVEAALQSIQQLREGCSAKLVAVGPSDDPRLILRAVHNGADDYLDRDAVLESELSALFKRLSATKRAAPGTGRLVVVASANGGSGRSLCAVNLAAALAQRLGRCGLCDFDLRAGDLATMLNLRPKHTIAHLCKDLAKLDRAMFERSLTADSSGVHLLAAPETCAEIEQTDFRGLATILKMARQTFSFVVVDLERYLRKESLQTMQLADVVLVLFRPDVVSLRSTRRLLDELLAYGVPEAAIRLVANRYERGRTLPMSKAQAALAMPVWTCLPEDNRTATLSCNTGRPAVLEAPGSVLGKAFIDCADALLTQCPVEGGPTSPAPRSPRANTLAALAGRIKAVIT